MLESRNSMKRTLALFLYASHQTAKLVIVHVSPAIRGSGRDHMWLLRVTR